VTAASALDLPVTTEEASGGISGGQPRRSDAVTLLSWYVFLLMILPSPLVFAPLGGAGSPATIFAALLFFGYLVTWLHPALAPARTRQPARIAAICFGCSIVASYVSANRHAMSTLEVNGADRGIIIAAGWLGVLLLTADGVSSIDRLRTLLRRIVIGGTAMAAVALAQFTIGLNLAKYIVIPGLVSQQPFTDLQARDALRRPSATALSPIELAAVLAMCLPLALHQARFAPKELRVRRWVQVAVIGAAVPMTVSRTAFIALAVVALVLLPTWPKRERRTAYLVGVFGLVAMWATIPGLAGAFRNLFGEVGSDASSTSRTGAFTESAPFISAHPWLGHGFGTFQPQTYFFTDDQYLGSLVQTGVIGLAALILLLITGWCCARSARRLIADPRLRDLAQCLAAGVAVAATSFATLDAFSFSIISGLTFVLIGSAGALWRLGRANPDPAPGNLVGAAPTLVSLD
jgi:polysaccharide biosynthesis protein PslJ